MNKNAKRSKRDFLFQLIKKNRKNLIKNTEAYNNLSVNLINNIIYNEQVKIVAIFKDYLIFDDISEFLKRYYTIHESAVRIKKACEFYDEFSKIFPNYTKIREAKYMYKNIKRKQKVIDNIQDKENHFQSEGDLNEFNEKVFDTEIYNSILNQSEFNHTLQSESSLVQKSLLVKVDESNKSLEKLAHIINYAETAVDQKKLPCSNKYINKNYLKQNIYIYNDDKSENKKKKEQTSSKSKHIKAELNVKKENRNTKNQYNFNLNLNMILNNRNDNNSIKLEHSNKNHKDRVNFIANTSRQHSNNKIKELYLDKKSEGVSSTVEKFSSNMVSDNITYLNSKNNTNHNTNTNNSIINKNDNNIHETSVNKYKNLHSERSHKKNEIRNLIIKAGKNSNYMKMTSNDKFIVFEENLTQRKKREDNNINNTPAAEKKHKKTRTTSSNYGTVYNINIINNYQNIFYNKGTTVNNKKKSEPSPAKRYAKSAVKPKNPLRVISDNSIIKKALKMTGFTSRLEDNGKDNKTIGYQTNSKKISFSTARMNNSKGHLAAAKSKTPPLSTRYNKENSRISHFTSQEKDLKMTRPQTKSKKLSKKIIFQDDNKRTKVNSRNMNDTQHPISRSYNNKNRNLTNTIDKKKLNKNYSSIIKSDFKIKEAKNIINFDRKIQKPLTSRQDQTYLNSLTPDSSRKNTKTGNISRVVNNVKIPFIKIENLNTNPNSVKQFDFYSNFKPVLDKKNIKLEPLPNTDRRTNKY